MQLLDNNSTVYYEYFKFSGIRLIHHLSKPIKSRVNQPSNNPVTLKKRGYYNIKTTIHQTNALYNNKKDCKALIY